MAGFSQSAADWGLHAAAAGAVVFALGWAWLARLRHPARRQQLGGWVVRGGVLAALLCLMPAWLVLPNPWQPEPAPVVVAATPKPPAAAEEKPAASPEPGAVPWLLTTPAEGQTRADGATKPPPADQKKAEPPRQRVVGGGVWQVPIRFHYHAEGVARGAGFAMAARAAEPVPRTAEPPGAPRFAAPAPVAPQHAPPMPELSGLLLLAYATGAAAAAFPLLLGVVGLARLRRSGKPASPGVQAVFDDIAAGLRPRPRLLVSDRLGSPVCFGLLRPAVVIPKPLAAAATAAELRWVFAHELDHLRRGDPWTAWWLGLAKALYFFVPWFWRVKRDLGLTQELLADAAAVAAGGRAEDYAAFLVKLSSGSCRRHPVGAAAVRAGKSDLYWRVTMLLASNDRPAPRGGRVWAAAVAAVVLGTALVVSGVGFARPDDKKADAPKAADKKPDEKKADEKKPGFDPKDVRVGPPPELAALREAVERAAKKGENVEEVRKSLDALEKALAGRAWVKPKVVEPPAPPAVPAPPGVPFPPAFPNPNIAIAPPAIAFPNLAQPDRELLKKAQDQMQRANEMLAKVPTDEDALKLLKEAREMMIQAMRAQIAIAPQVAFPGGGAFPGVAVGGFGGFGAQQVRLGIRVEKVPSALADQLDLPKGRGVLVADIGKDTAAEKAGIKAHDVILEFAGKPVSDDPTELVRAIQGLKKDEKVDVTFLRKGRKETVKGVEVPEAKAGVLFPNGGDFPVPIAVDAPPVPPVPPVPPLKPVKPLAPPPGDGASSAVSIQVSDRNFTIDAVQDGTKIHIEGEIQADGSAAASKVVITDPKGEKVADVKDADKVPADYRDRVKKLLSGVKGGK